MKTEDNHIEINTPGPKARAAKLTKPSAADKGPATPDECRTPEPEGFITKEALAMRLSRTVRTVENWQRRGIIPYVKCGRSVLFKWTDVETHLQTHYRVCGRSHGPKRFLPASQRSVHRMNDHAIRSSPRLSVVRKQKRNISERNTPGSKNGPSEINGLHRVKRNGRSVLISQSGHLNGHVTPGPRIPVSAQPEPITPARRKAPNLAKGLELRRLAAASGSADELAPKYLAIE